MNHSISNFLVENGRKWPEKTVLICREKKWNFAELCAATERLAKVISALPGTNIMVCDERSDLLVVTFLSVLRAGKTYIPVDPNLPEGRIKYIEEVVKPDLVIGGKNEREKFGEEINWINTNEFVEMVPGESSGEQRSETAYIIFTSGTTGKPKAIPISYASLDFKMSNFNNEIQLSTDLNWLLLSSIGFDASIAQILLPVISGGTLHIIEVAKQKDVFFTWKYIMNNSINILYTIPSYIKALIHTPFDYSGISFKYLLLGAEKFPPALLKSINASLRVDTVINMYGPTETTINAAMHITNPGEGDRKSVPIGKALPGYDIKILDSNLQEVDSTEEGEIAISAPHMTEGYLFDPDKGKEKFITLNSGERFYLSGDTGFVNSEGNLEITGRIDNQVKISGFRIELEEIESAISEVTGVGEVIVLMDKVSLVAIVETSGQNSDHLEKNIKQSLMDRLPYYMQPSRFIFPAKFPRLVSGKKDRKGALELLKKSIIVKSTEPATPLEEKVLHAWKEVFEREDISLADNFLELGGGSIQSIMIVNHLLKEGLELAPEDVFNHPTIPGQAQIVKKSSRKVELRELSTFHEESNFEESFNLEGKTRIESIGSYVPDNLVSTEQIVSDCKGDISFPLERLTGIKKRPVADGEFSLDIAKKAVKDCLSNSGYKPEDIELVITCQISRRTGERTFVCEPSVARILCVELGMINAEGFDISNACAGMFTACLLADQKIRIGEARNVLVVSGENITHLTKSAQLEIEDGKFDPRLACLTLGDAGVALIMEESDDYSGFDALDLITLSEYSDLCIAKMSPLNHGGAIMHSDPIRSSSIGIRPGIEHTLDTMKTTGWKETEVDHFIIHQTSVTTIRNSVRELNNLMGETVAHEENTLINLENRGNSASTCQFLAFHEAIKAGKIKDGQKVVFPVSGSGRTIGTALYQLDGLPGRINKSRPGSRESVTEDKRNSFHFGTEILSSSVYQMEKDHEISTEFMSLYCAEEVIADSGIDRNEIGVFIFSGIYRDEFVAEPALAALLARKLRLKGREYIRGSNSNLCFDVINGDLGTLNAIQVASEFIKSGKSKYVLIVTSEVDNNKAVDMDPVHSDFVEGASAILLGRNTDKSMGIQETSYTRYLPNDPVFSTYIDFKEDKIFLRKEDFELPVSELILAQLTECVKNWEIKSGRVLSEMDYVLIPGFGTQLINKFSEHFSLDPKQVILSGDPSCRPYTSMIIEQIRTLMGQTSGKEINAVCLVPSNLCDFAAIQLKL